MSQFRSSDPQPLPAPLRRVFNTGLSVAATSTNRIAFAIVPANSVLRSIYFAADATLVETRFVDLRLAYGITNSPSEDDFIGTGLILPSASQVGIPAVYTADPAIAAQDINYNIQLPDHPGQVLAEFVNANAQPIVILLRIVVDALGRLGGSNGSR